MKTKSEEIKAAEKDMLKKDYEELFEKVPILKESIEWRKEGDFFQKFSMYDRKFLTRSSGSTTLLNKRYTSY